jgi:hypothetical protein
MKASILEPPTIDRRWFYSFSHYKFEYIYDVNITAELIAILKNSGSDFFTFIQRTFIEGHNEFPLPFTKQYENIAIMPIKSFDDWWINVLGKKERQSVKKANKSGIEVRRIHINDEFLFGVQKIYNESEFREGRRYSGFGLSLNNLRDKFENIGDSEMLGAYFNSELVGILWLAFGDNAAMFRSFVSLMKHRDKCPNNALIAAAVKRCAERQVTSLVYGNHYGFLPSLDQFRSRQGFKKCPVPRYVFPLTWKGQLALNAGLHRGLQYSLPPIIQRSFLKLYNPISRMMPASLWWKLASE